MSDLITDSQFYMWRAIFAVAHADGIVTDEEVRFMAETLELLPFSESQRATLSHDAKETQNIEDMFKGITDAADQAEFFKIAHKLVHIDGDYGAAEQSIMLKLKNLHVREINLDDLVGRVDLQLEDDNQGNQPQEETNKSPLKSFRDRFLDKIYKR
ncbi:MAG: DUF533 domain-containing protein [Alphaproteobacteria bacterium]